MEPSPVVTSQSPAGSDPRAALMRTPNLVADCVAAMRAAVAVPVTVKTRLGVDEHDSYGFLCELVTSVIAGPRTLEQWTAYVDAIGTPWSDEDEALVDSLVAPGHPSTPGYNDPQYAFYGRKRRG